MEGEPTFNAFNEIPDDDKEKLKQNLTHIYSDNSQPDHPVIFTFESDDPDTADEEYEKKFGRKLDRNVISISRVISTKKEDK